MANRRMISVSISVSEQVALLKNDFTRMLFTWMIPHADDYGILPGSARRIRALVVPMLDCSIQDVEDALADIEAHELIWRYQWTDGSPWLQFRTWEKHQSGLHKRVAPRNPRHSDTLGITQFGVIDGDFREVPGSSGDVPGNSALARARGTELKRREGKGSSVPGNGSSAADEVATAIADGDAPPSSLSEPSQAETPPTSLTSIPASRAKGADTRDTQEDPTPPSSGTPPSPARGLPKERKPRVDPIWDALTRALALDAKQMTKNERSNLGGVAKQLREAGATPDDVAARVARMIEDWGPDRVTVNTVANHWSEFDPARPRTPKPKAAQAQASAGVPIPTTKIGPQPYAPPIGPRRIATS